MNTWLYLTAEGLDAPSSDWPCCVWSSSNQRKIMPLNQAAQVLKGQAIDLLLPMEMCSWVRSDPWPSRRRPDTQAIAYAVENQLSEALEEMHLSMGVRDQEGRYPVMVIGRRRMTDLLALLTGSGLEVRSAFVDADVLPNTQAVIVRWFGRWLASGAMAARIALSDKDLTLLRPALPSNIQWIDERSDAVDVDQCFTARPPKAINLLQGEFAPRRKRLPWRLGSLTMVVLLLLIWGKTATRTHFLEVQAQQLYDQSLERFKELYPRQTRIVDLAAQFDALKVDPSKNQSRLFNQLDRIIEQAIGERDVEIERIELQPPKVWKVQLNTSNFAQLDKIREEAQNNGIATDVANTRKVHDRIEALMTFEVNNEK